MNNQKYFMDSNKLETFMTDVFIGLGVPKGEAAICSDVLISADKRGIDSHGIGRLKPIYYDRIVKDKIQSATTEFEIIRDNKTTAVIDGHHGMGMVIAQKSMQMAIDKAKEYGVGIVSVRNSTHYGYAAHYPLMACNAGLMGFTTTNARPSIAPTFGVENMLGTNPLVFGIPTDEGFHFTNDYATSITQRGKIEQYAREGKSVPEGLVIDRNGNTKSDASEILKDLVAGSAALTPVGGIGEDTGGYKGYGFATVVEILSSAFAQGSFLSQLSGISADGSKKPYGLGHFFMAVDIENFCDLNDFKKHVGDILRELRNSEKAPGCDKIYTAGEKEHIASLKRKESGILLDKELQTQMITMRDELGLNTYEFDFE